MAMNDASLVVHVSEEIAAALAAATPVRRKLAAIAACAVAAGMVSIEHPVVGQTLAELQAGRKPPPPVLAELRALAEALEERYLQLVAEPSDSDPGIEMDAFAQARLTACLLEAVDSESAGRATAAVYEAIAASGDEQSVSRSVRLALKQ
jgi:hypothetical protein